MKVDGKEFLRNVGIEEDKENLKKAQEKLEEQKRESIIKEPSFFDNNPPEDEAVTLNLSSQTNTPPPPPNDDDFNNLYDIKLDPEANSNNRKKYIIMIISAIVLFVLTIVVIRLISNNQEEDKLNSSAAQTQQITKDSQLDQIKTNEEYQKIIGKPDVKDIKDVEEHFKKETPTQRKQIILPEPIKEEPPVKIEKKTVETPKKDLFGLRDIEMVEDQAKEPVKQIVQKKEEIKKIAETIPAKPKPVVETPKKKIVVDPPKVTNFVKKEEKTAISQGYYVQVGSFSKKPSDKFLRNIALKGYTYKVHQMDVKGKTYNKVLIGVYPSYGVAKGKLPKIKKDLNAPGAYILKL